MILGVLEVVLALLTPRIVVVVLKLAHGLLDRVPVGGARPDCRFRELGYLPLERFEPRDHSFQCWFHLVSPFNCELARSVHSITERSRVLLTSFSTPELTPAARQTTFAPQPHAGG